MGWVRKSPFANHEEPVEHILDLLATEAGRAGMPLTDAERRTLADEFELETPLSEELSAKARKLIELVFDHEADIDDPKSLGNSLAWASEGRQSNVAALAEEIIVARAEKPSRLHGRKWIFDRIQLIGCGFVVVILLMLFGVVVDMLFSRK